MEKGYKTTEFYMTIGNMIAGFAIMLGLKFSGSQNELGELIGQLIGGIIALGGLISYILSRTELKKTLLKDNSTIQG